jgi:hypothetical protein
MFHRLQLHRDEHARRATPHPLEPEAEDSLMVFDWDDVTPARHGREAALRAKKRDKTKRVLKPSSPDEVRGELARFLLKGRNCAAGYERSSSR